MTNKKSLLTKQMEGLTPEEKIKKLQSILIELTLACDGEEMKEWLDSNMKGILVCIPHPEGSKSPIGDDVMIMGIGKHSMGILMATAASIAARSPIHESSLIKTIQAIKSGLLNGVEESKLN